MAWILGQGCTQRKQEYLGKTLQAPKMNKTDEGRSGSPMCGVRAEQGRIMYFGNSAGYIAGSQAVVDPISKGRGLETYLERQGGIEEVVWKGGVYDRLMNGQVEVQGGGSLKNCRIQQLKPDVNIYVKFIGYEMLAEEFEEPEPDNYRMVYDGEIETNEMEQTFERSNSEQEVPEYMGYSLSVSDVIELYDEGSSKSHYVDYTGFEPVAFGGPGPSHPQTFQL